MAKLAWTPFHPSTPEHRCKDRQFAVVGRVEFCAFDDGHLSIDWPANSGGWRNLGPGGRLRTWAGLEAAKFVAEGFADALGGAGGAGCPVHAGQIHGKEAEELRRGFERIADGDRACSRKEVQKVLDRVDARDSLAFLEVHDGKVEAATREKCANACEALRPGHTLDVTTGKLVSDPDGPWGMGSSFAAACRKVGGDDPA